MNDHLHQFALTAFEPQRTINTATVTCDCGEVRQLPTGKTKDAFMVDVAAYNDDPAANG